MTDSLIRFEQSLPAPESDLSTQFFDWEQRGRGWPVFEFPVELEPPFRPFFFFEATSGPLADDGRIETFFSSLVAKNPSPTQTLIISPNDDKQLRERYLEYIAEHDEPEFCSYYGAEYVETSLQLPSDFKTIASSTEQLLLSLSYCSHPCAFEIVGSAESIIVQLSATEMDSGHVYQQLKAHLPDCRFDRQLSEQNLWDRWINTGTSAIAVDFGLSEAFMLPLKSIDDLHLDPLISLAGALSDLADDELGLFQVLFQRARDEWASEIFETLACVDGSGLVDHIPGLQGMVRQKFGSPLFAVVIRVGAKAGYDDRAMQIVKAMAGSLAQLDNPAGNSLIPLSNEQYDDDDHERALLDRQTYRTGMLLNSRELLSLVHPPSASVRSAKLVRRDDRSKPAPQIAQGHALVLGENIHEGVSSMVSLSNEQRTRHIHIIGSSGSGKSTLLLNLIHQDLNAGQGFCVIDPHGDLIDQVIERVPDDRLGDVILFDPSDSEFPIGFNILHAASDLEKTVLSSDLSASFRRLATSWGDVMDTVLANAVLAFIESTKGGHLSDLKRFLVEKAFRENFLKSVTDEAIKYFWTHEFPLLANKPQASILIRLDTFLRQKLIRNIVCQKENRLNFRKIMDEGKVLLIKLSQGLIGEENSHLLGTLLVSKIYQTALTRQDSPKRPFFWVYIDEFQHFITPSMEGILSGTRKYNLGLTLAHQEFRQLQSRNQEVASSVLSNCYTRICFRLGDTDAERLSSGFSFFDAKALQNLGIGEAIGRIERANYDFNITTSQPIPVDTKRADKRKATIVEKSRALFARARLDVETELQSAFPADPPKKAPLPVIAAPRSSETAEQHRSATELAQAEDFAQEIPRIVTNTVPPESDRASQEHRYLQSLIKRLAEDKGYRVTVEKGVFGGAGKIDLVLENEVLKVGCEISVTNEPDYEVRNIEKCLSAGYAPVVMISPNPKRLAKIREKAESDLSPESFALTHYLPPDEFMEWLDGITTGNETGDKVKGYTVKVNVRSKGSTDQKTRRRAISDVIFGAFKRSKNKPDNK